MVLLKIIGSVFLIVIAIILLLATMSVIHRLWVLLNRRCKYCGHKTSYKGVVEHEGISQYMFYCPVCGAWEYTPVNEAINEKKDCCDGKGV